MSPKGDINESENVMKFCREHNLNSAHMIQVAKGNKKHYKK